MEQFRSGAALVSPGMFRHGFQDLIHSQEGLVISVFFLLGFVPRQTFYTIAGKCT